MSKQNDRLLAWEKECKLLESSLKSIKYLGEYATQSHDKDCKCATCEIVRLAKRAIV